MNKFAKEVLAQVVIPEGYEVELTEIVKVNTTMTGLRYFNRETGVSPLIYIDDLYKRYSDEEISMKEVISQINNTISSLGIKVGPMEAVDILSDEEGVKQKIIYQLINAERNDKMLETHPHRIVEDTDLALIYRIIVDTKDEMIASAVITVELAKKLGLSESDLYELATKNTPLILPPTVKDLSEIMMEIMGDFGGELPEDNQHIMVVSNKNNLNGAGVILYEGILDQICQEKGTEEIYILPSSLHECLVIPARENVEAEELLCMVESVNETEVSTADFLADSVYKYSLAEKKLCKVA